MKDSFSGTRTGTLTTIGYVVRSKTITETVTWTGTITGIEKGYRNMICWF